MKTEKIAATIIFFITALFTIFIAYCFIRLTFYSKYLSKEDLIYEQFTFIEYKYIIKNRTRGKTMYYEIYVEELDKPIIIDNIIYSKANTKVLDSVKEKDKIIASIKRSTKRINAYEIKYGNQYILMYEDYVQKHGHNDTVGSVVTSVMLCILLGLLTAEIIYYKKYGSFDGIF